MLAKQILQVLLSWIMQKLDAHDTLGFGEHLKAIFHDFSIFCVEVPCSLDEWGVIAREAILAQPCTMPVTP